MSAMPQPAVARYRRTPCAGSVAMNAMPYQRLPATGGRLAPGALP